jgi:hypothetical protein
MMNSNLSRLASSLDEEARQRQGSVDLELVREILHNNDPNEMEIMLNKVNEAGFDTPKITAGLKPFRQVRS